jgi:ankyrin repeat protein
MLKEMQVSRKLMIDAAGDVENRARDSNRLQSELLLEKLHQRDEDGVIAALTENVEGRSEDNADGGVVFRDQIENFGEVYFTDIADSLGSTPLMLAAGRNMLEAVFKLIEMGVPIDEANKHGHNPLIWAAICGHGEVIKALLFRGANINHRTAEGRTALHYTCLYSKAKAADILMEFMFEKFQTFRLDHPRY